MEKNKLIPFQFEVKFDASRFSNTSDPELRTGKVRVFYKYLNRNGSYISDGFAEKLALSAYSKPIFGTYDINIEDFKGHEGHEEAKSYGYVVPGSLTWEDNVDEDGVTRRYATYDVVIWAKYWKEAEQIFTKKQSMEIDPDTIKGEWMYILHEGEEEYAYVYNEGVIAGLCILGEKHPPCFQGSAFFSTEDDSYKEFSLAIKNYYKNGGMDAMELENQEAIVEEQEQPVEEATPVAEEEVNPPVAEEESAPAAEEQPAVELAEPVVEEQPATEEQPAAEPAAEEPSVPAEPEKDYAAMYNDLKAQYETLTNELADLRSQYTSLEEEKNNLVEEFESLKVLSEGYKTDITAQHSLIEKYENEEKERIIAKFSGRLPADIVSQIEEAKETMTIDEMNTRFAMEYTSFSMAREQNEEIRVPQLPQEEPSALARILKNYKR